jgi:hypothetical protein
MPFDLTNAPASFIALMYQAIREHLDRYCVAYMNAILGFDTNTEEHIGHEGIRATLKAPQMRVRRRRG